MKTLHPSGVEGILTVSLRAANEPQIPAVSGVTFTHAPSRRTGWDPYDVWRTRVKTPRDDSAPPAETR
jgi:hypothetical protein